MKQTNQRNTVFRQVGDLNMNQGTLENYYFVIFLLRVINTDVYGYRHIYLKFLAEVHAEKLISEMI